MTSTAAFSETVSLIYASAISSELWGEAVARIHQTMSSATAGVGQVRSSTLIFANRVSRSVVGVFDPEVDRAYQEHYGSLDHVLREVERGPVGVVRTGNELIAPHTQTEFHTDWVRPNDIDDGIFVRLSHDATPTCLTIAGPKSSEVFDTEERTGLLTLLIPHLEQTLRIQNALSDLSWRTSELSKALDSIEHAIVTVSSDFKIVHGNAAAERLLEQSDGLKSRAGRLVALAGDSEVNLQAQLNLALRGDSAGVRRGGTLSCARPSGKRAHAVYVLPLAPGITEFARSRPTAMVVIVDSERRPVPTAEILRQLFDFTKTEAIVAQLVMNGEGLGPIADQLSISRDTVKTHLARIFHKTDTNRQGELVRLLLAVIA